MTTPQKRQRGPKTVATPEQVEQAKAPEAFRLPTVILVDLLKLLDTIPPSKSAMTYLQLQRLQPIVDSEPSGTPE